MTTKKQIEANRRNAKKSTGPKTPEGKARSAQNATRHGLTSRRVVLADEDEAEFKELRINLYLDLAPEGQLEVLLVNRIAAQQWRLARIPALEAELFDALREDVVQGDLGLGGAWARDSEPYGGALSRLARYETMLERSTSRLLAELRRVQAARRRAERELPPPERYESRPEPAGPALERGGISGLGLAGTEFPNEPNERGTMPPLGAGSREDGSARFETRPAVAPQQRGSLQMPIR